MNSQSVKTFDEMYDVISFARQCVSQNLKLEEYTVYDNIRKVLKYVNIDAFIFTRHNMVCKDFNKASNIIFCHDDIDCIFINQENNYIIYYSPRNKTPSLLIERFLSIHYPQNKLILLTNVMTNKPIYNLKDWISVLLFVITTNIKKECNNKELIETLSEQLNDNKFRKLFDELCNVVVSNHSNITKIDTTRPRGINNVTNKTSQNLSKILDILYDVVDWSCEMIKEDEKVRETELYSNLAKSTTFKTVKKHIKISKLMVYETIIKLWNRLNYDLTLNIDNKQLIKMSSQNILYCLTTHYKYVIHILINLLQTNNEDSIISHHVTIIMKLGEEYNKKVYHLRRLSDEIDSLINDVITYCNK